MELLVQEIELLALDIKGFTLAHPDGGKLPDFVPGSHIKVSVCDDTGEDVTRSYSLYNDPRDGVYKIAVLLDPDSVGGSRYMHEQVAVGDRLRCSAPACDFSIREDTQHAILLAGGIGITPILSMARALSQAGRSFTVHYAAKSNAHMALYDVLLAFAGDRTTLYFDGGDVSRGIPLSHVLATPQPNTHVYVCGPSGLIDATGAAAQAKGWDGAQVVFERFSAPAVSDDDTAFSVILSQSGKTLAVAADKTILSALVEEGVDPLYDCEAGNCGLCVQTVSAVDGTIDHRDAFLSEQQKSANDQICVCVSRIKGDSVTLDL